MLPRGVTRTGVSTLKLRNLYGRGRLVGRFLGTAQGLNRGRLETVSKMNVEMLHSPRMFLLVGKILEKLTKKAYFTTK